MSLRRSVEGMTVEEYLEFEKTSDVRHEYLDGEIYAMSGASRRHNLITNRLNIELATHLRKSQCQVFIVEVKVYIRDLHIFYYPDLVVTCDPDDRDDYYVTRPVLVVEVQSQSTVAIDRREKLMAYRRLESLQEYLLLSQSSISGDLFRRVNGTNWNHEQIVGDQELRLESVNMTLMLSTVYEGIV